MDLVEHCSPASRSSTATTTCCGRPASACGYDFGRLDVGTAGQPTHTDLPRLVEGGIGAQFWSVYVPTPAGR